MEAVEANNGSVSPAEELARSEGKLWANHLLRSSNPAIAQGGIFLVEYFNLDYQEEVDSIPGVNARELTPLEIFEAEVLSEFFSNHSNVGLISLSEFIGEWCEI